jgi:glycosyltransferase involved in cell wall biosynthesis
MAASHEHVPVVSVVIPVCNEEENLRPLYACLNGALEGHGRDYEVIFIDDGSADGSRKVLQDLAEQDKRVRVITLRTNLGKSMALAVGFRHSRGEIIITMDADLQDDPEEIPGFLKAIEGGYDLVSGWRKSRRDPRAKIVLSRMYNWATRIVTGVPLHDFNCGIKAYRRDLLSSLRVYGELHRYIPVLAAWRGYRITELPVRHHPRRAGRSKYGTARIPHGFLDLLTIVFLTRYDKRPLHFLGGTGILMLLLGLGINLYMTILWLGNRPIGNRPLLFLGILLLLVGVQFVFFGLLAEFLLHLHLRADDRYLNDAIASGKRDGGDGPPV